MHDIEMVCRHNRGNRLRKPVDLRSRSRPQRAAGSGHDTKKHAAVRMQPFRRRWSQQEEGVPSGHKVVGERCSYRAAPPDGRKTDDADSHEFASLSIGYGKTS